MSCPRRRDSLAFDGFRRSTWEEAVASGSMPAGIRWCLAPAVAIALSVLTPAGASAAG